MRSSSSSSSASAREKGRARLDAFRKQKLKKKSREEEEEEEEESAPLSAPTVTAVDGIADADADAAGFVRGGIEKTGVLDEKEAQSVGQIGNRGGEEAEGATEIIRAPPQPQQQREVEEDSKHQTHVSSSVSPPTPSLPRVREEVKRAGEEEEQQEYRPPPSRRSPSPSPPPPPLPPATFHGQKEPERDARMEKEEEEANEMRKAMALVKERESEEYRRQLDSIREQEHRQKLLLEEREEEIEALRESLLDTNEMLSEERKRAEEMNESLMKAELRATTAEETLRAYASIVPESTNVVKKETVVEEAKEEEKAMEKEASQIEKEEEHERINEPGVSERDVLRSARDAMRRERDQAIAKQRVAENKAVEIEEELRDAEYTIMALRQDLKAAEENQRLQGEENGERENDINDDNEEFGGQEKQTKADAALIAELHAARRKNEQLAEALHQSKEQIVVFKNLSEKTKSMADKVESEADELENAIVAGEEKTRMLAKSLLEERRKVKNLRETVDIVARLVEKLTTLENDNEEGTESARSLVPESPFRSLGKTKSRLTDEEALEESLREEDEMFDDETFFEKTIERVKNALDYKIERLESLAREHVEKAKELGILLSEADDEIVAQLEVIEQLQMQRDALLEEIESRDEHLDSIERDLEHMLQTEGKLREEVLNKEKLFSEETAKNDKLMTLIEEQAMWTSDKENANPSASKDKVKDDDDGLNDTDRDQFERLKRDNNLNSNYSKSAPATPAKTRRIRSGGKNGGIDIAKDVYAPLLVTIEKRLQQLKDDRRKLATSK